MLKEYMVRERFGTPGLDVDDTGKKYWLVS